MTCNTIGIYTSLTVAPATTGASGWLKVTNVSGTPGAISSVTYAGFTLTANGAAIRGFIEVNGDESSTVAANRLGTFRVTGEWFELGTTSGSSNQTLQIPTNGLLRYVAGVFIEATAGAGDYEFWPNAGGGVTTLGTEEARGKVVWIPDTGLCRIGNSGAATNGHTPTSGRKVVVPNIFFENNTTAARTVNALPHATVGTRHLIMGSGAPLIIDKANLAWMGYYGGYSVEISNTGVLDQFSLGNTALAATINKLGVGGRPTTVLSAIALSIVGNTSGTTFTDCVWSRPTMGSSGFHTASITNCANLNFVRNTFRANTIRGHATTYSMLLTNVDDCTWTDTKIVQGQVHTSICSGLSFTDTAFCSAVSGTAATTASSVWSLTNTTINCTFDGLTFPVTNTHPYTALLSATTSSRNITLRNVGSYASPLSFGSVNACGLIYSLATSVTDVRIQRVYASNTRTGTMTSDSSSSRVSEENVFSDYADAPVAAVTQLTRRGCGFTPDLTAQTGIYGTHFIDCHTSTTAGRIAILMNEANATTASQVALTGGAAFTALGGLSMPTIGMTATFETPIYLIGHTGFANTALVMAGGTAGDYTYEYAIDKNDGSGFSTMTSSAYTAAGLGTALNGLTGIDASLGFKLKLKITTSSTNTTPITSVYVTTTSTTTTQAYQYPLDAVPVTITVKDSATGAAIQNARIRITTDVGGHVVLSGVTNASGVLTGDTEYASHAISGTVRRATVADGTLYKPGSIAGTTTSDGFTATVLMIADE